MKKKLLALAISGTTALSAITIMPMSAADSGHNPAVEGIDLNENSTPQKSKVKYSDEDVLKLIIFAQGPIAEQRPDLAEKLLKGKPKPKLPDDAVFEDVVSQLKRVDPEYHEVVTKGVQKNDPLKAEAAMKRLSDDLNKIYELEKRPDQERGVTTWAWHDAHVFAETELAAAAAAVVFEAVGAAHVAAVVVAIVPAAVSYQFEFNHGSTVDRQAMVAAVSQAAAS